MHLLVVARSPREGIHSWYRSHGGRVWWRSSSSPLMVAELGGKSPISTHGSGAWWRGVVAELAPSTHGIGASLSVHRVLVVWGPGAGLRSCVCILWSWPGAPGRCLHSWWRSHSGGDWWRNSSSPLMVAELGGGTRPFPVMVAEPGGEAWWRSSPLHSW